MDTHRSVPAHLASLDSALDTPQRIVIPLDGSAMAEAALASATALAHVYDIEIVLVHGFAAESYLPSGSAGNLAQPKTAHLSLDDTAAYLGRIERQLRDRGLRVASQILRLPAAYAIVEIARSVPTSLVVMTTHLGAGGSSAPSPARVALDVLHHTRTPVLLLPTSAATPFARGQTEGTHVLALVREYSEWEAVPRYAFQLARALHGTLTLACLPAKPAALPPAGEGKAPARYSPDGISGRAAMLARISHTAAHFREQGVDTEVLTVEKMLPEEEGARLAETHADLVVVGGESQLEQRVVAIGHIARMLRMHPIPLLFFPCDS